ncbi:hypothetical protein EUX98_g1110 [Antrodiella citrinella]|uniref:Extracellular metalloproteinase n=1 Tax=Antrodiella citrinella TaxID=2447956 RepID=A0A4S4N4R5_9APHY|nr:hypothetical protein EUX98_g1110 [Antrodiella citrinella]
MRTFTAVIAVLSTFAAVSAKNIVVTVGGNTTSNATSVFQPAEIFANLNDIVVFSFTQGNHTVTQSSFGNPCIFLDFTNTTQHGFDSGFRNAGNGSNVTIETVPITPELVNQTLWFFDFNTCAEGGVGGININDSSTATLDGIVLDEIVLSEDLSLRCVIGAALKHVLEPYRYSGDFRVQPAPSSGALVAALYDPDVAGNIADDDHTGEGDYDVGCKDTSVSHSTKCQDDEHGHSLIPDSNVDGKAIAYLWLGERYPDDRNGGGGRRRPGFPNYAVAAVAMMENPRNFSDFDFFTMQRHLPDLYAFIDWKEKAEREALSHPLDVGNVLGVEIDAFFNRHQQLEFTLDGEELPEETKDIIMKHPRDPSKDVQDMLIPSSPGSLVHFQITKVVRDRPGTFCRVFFRPAKADTKERSHGGVPDTCLSQVVR